MPRGRGRFWMHGRFRGCGYRLTAPRQAIMEVLSKGKKHLTAEEIYFEVHKKYPAIGLTTVYRTLELLVNMGFLVRFDFGDKKARFELIEGPHVKHHHHLYCKGCGRIIDYSEYADEEKELLEKTENGLEKKYKFKIDSHQICFYGLCEKCK